MENHDHRDTGLRGIPVADTSIALIDGQKGHLYYRGYSIEDLAKHSTYEEVAYLLIYGEMPTRTQYEEFTVKLATERTLSPELISYLQNLPKAMPPMSFLQSSVALLSGSDPELTDESWEANCRKAIRIIAKLPTLVAFWQRIQDNHSLKPPDETLTHAANFLYMLRDEEVDAEVAKCFDVALILHAEHSFNASTFTSRVIASTRAHLYASLSGAIGSLSGTLHGGANSGVMRNLQEIGAIKNVEPWVRNQFDQQQRILGMGHAVYQTMDPRAKILQRMAEKLIQGFGETKWYKITQKLVEFSQREFHIRKGQDRQIYPNVDLYSASVYYSIGIPIDLFTPVFAISRSAGWVAHILEEKFPTPPVKPVLYRPSATYSGNYCGAKGCKYIPIDDRD